VSQHDDNANLTKLLARIGCPESKVGEMASQLAKRSGQLAKERNITGDQAMTHLLQLMRQDWTAKEQTDAD